MKRLKEALLTAVCMLAAAGCGAPGLGEMTPLPEEGTPSQVHQAEASVNSGSYLFKKETFGGNGRTCDTCHTARTGTLSPAEISNRLPTDPIFQAIDSDARLGISYAKLMADATVTVDIPLPPNIEIATDPSARIVTLRRGIPTTYDTPALDPVLMWDGREPTLQHQAAGAIQGHAGGRMPTPEEADSIAKFEKTLFTSGAMAAFAAGTAGPPPIPEGTTASEKRGAAFFAPTGLCGSCHGGPLLNTMTGFNPQGLPAGSRFSSAAVSEVNLAQNPLIPFVVTNPADGTKVTIFSPDPGLMLVTGNPAHANVFKMASLRNLKNTAPYFHDNSAKTLDAVMVQYKLLFDFLGVPLSPQDMEDIKAYMKLL